MKQRFELLDLWRSLCVFLMIIYHTFWDLTEFGFISDRLLSSVLAIVFRNLIGGSFVFLSGITCFFSKDPLHRGFRLLCFGLGVRVFAAFLHYPIQFGILEFMGLSMLSLALLHKVKIRLNRYCYILIAILFAVTAMITHQVRVKTGWLYPFGFIRNDFYSVDYWPLFPWIFLFYLGCGLGEYFNKHQNLKVFQLHFPKMLTFLGKNSLLIYLTHQPVLYGAIWIIKSAMV